MRNYIHADIKRILSRKSHAFSMLLLFAIYALMLYMPNRDLQMTSVALINSACSNLGYLALFIGLFEMLAVFSEDFKVKTMQVAIGLGVSRSKVVLCKLLEVFILLVIDSLALLAIVLGVGGLLGVSVPMTVLKDLIVTLLTQVVWGNTVYTSLTMIVLFSTHSSVLAIFVYVLLGIDVINIILSLLPLVGIDFLEPLKLTNLTHSSLINVFETRLALGTFDVLSLLGTMVYVALGVFGTFKIFAHRELDF